MLLVGLVLVFTVLTAIVLRKTEKLQGRVERYHSTLAEHASDALGNVPVIQSFTRIEAETRLAAPHHPGPAARAEPGPVLVGDRLGGDRAPPRRITVTAIFLVGTCLHLNGLATIGEVVIFMSIATMLIGAPRAGGQLRQPALHAGAEDARVLRDPRHRAGRARPAPRQGRRALRGRRRLRERELLLRRQAAGGAGRLVHGRARARTSRSSAPPARASRRRSASCIAPSIRNPA